jgi:hypothetical protein
VNVHQDDEGLIESLRQIYRDDVRRATRDLRNHPPLVVRRKPLSSWGNGFGALAAALVLVVGLAVLSRPSAQPDGAVVGASTRATGNFGAAQTPTPGSTGPTATTLVDGLPTEIGGVPVLRGEAALSAIKSTHTGESLLVGGWDYGGDVFCGFFTSWWMSCYHLRLQASAAAGSSVFLYLGPTSPDAPSLAPNLGEDQTQPIVVQIHTHDASCPPANATCATRPVIDRVVWRGAVQAGPSEFGPPPSGGLSESDAVAAARKEAEAQAGGPVTLVIAEAGPYGHVGPTGDDVAADHWVWAVVFSGEFPAPACSGSSCRSVDRALVVVDYIDGKVLIDELYGSSAPA